MGEQAKSKSAQEKEVREAGAPDDANVKAGLPDTAARREAGEQSGQQAPRFSRERLLGPDAQSLTGHPTNVLAGALALDDRDEFTQAQVDAAVAKYHGRKDTSVDAETAKQQED